MLLKFSLVALVNTSNRRKALVVSRKLEVASACNSHSRFGCQKASNHQRNILDHKPKSTARLFSVSKSRAYFRQDSLSNLHTRDQLDTHDPMQCCHYRFSRHQAHGKCIRIGSNGGNTGDDLPYVFSNHTLLAITTDYRSLFLALIRVNRTTLLLGSVWYKILCWGGFLDAWSTSYGLLNDPITGSLKAHHWVNFFWAQVCVIGRWYLLLKRPSFVCY